jgi:hypothetical protein
MSFLHSLDLSTFNHWTSHLFVFTLHLFHIRLLCNLLLPPQACLCAVHIRRCGVSSFNHFISISIVMQLIHSTAHSTAGVPVRRAQTAQWRRATVDDALRLLARNGDGDDDDGVDDDFGGDGSEAGGHTLAGMYKGATPPRFHRGDGSTGAVALVDSDGALVVSSGAIASVVCLLCCTPSARALFFFLTAKTSLFFCM